LWCAATQRCAAVGAALPLLARCRNATVVAAFPFAPLAAAVPLICAWQNARGTRCVVLLVLPRAIIRAAPATVRRATAPICQFITARYERCAYADLYSATSALPDGCVDGCAAAPANA